VVAWGGRPPPGWPWPLSTKGKNSELDVDRPARAPSRFEEFWKECHRRDGPNLRKLAEAKFNALVKSGADQQMLIDEAKKWREAEESRGIGRRFYSAGCEWLNQRRWLDHAAIPLSSKWRALICRLSKRCRCSPRSANGHGTLALSGG
jgi:hypothetical protein